MKSRMNDIGFLLIVDFVIQQSASGSASAPLPAERMEFIKKLGLNAKENMSWASFTNETTETQ